MVLQSRQQRPLTRYFPEITAALATQIPAGTVLDGELVVYRDGQCDFAALQRRTSGQPALASAASLVVLDLLAEAGRDLRGLPDRKRRKRLRRLLDVTGPPLLLMAATLSGARTEQWAVTSSFRPRLGPVLRSPSTKERSAAAAEHVFAALPRSWPKTFIIVLVCAPGARRRVGSWRRVCGTPRAGGS